MLTPSISYHPRKVISALGAALRLKTGETRVPDCGDVDVHPFFVAVWLSVMLEKSAPQKVPVAASPNHAALLPL